MISKKAIDLILEMEGIDQPSRWPGGSSGITIGYGYDLGYEENFREDWEGQLPVDHLNLLATAIGKKGGAARAIASRFRNITISEGAARTVFLNKTLPAEIKKTRKAFPGFEEIPTKSGFEALPADAQGALVSLVYNRGNSMDGSRRVEMRAIRAAVKAGDLPVISEQIRLMKRLWIGTDIAKGMSRRRDREAQLVEEATAS
jgi:GH24 family phage-related lysozyme (muramidase)